MVSRLTAMMVATNEVKVIETSERVECWLVKDGDLHALLLSCPLGKRADMDSSIASIKETYGTVVGEESSKGKYEAHLKPDACCANEKRNMNGGCDNCGDPCL